MYEPNFRPAGGVYPQPRQGFWRRQFAPHPTRAQRRFDVAFGLVLPVLCFVCDPVVFRGWLLDGEGFYSRAQAYVYAVSALELVALAAWLFRAGGAGRPPAALGGVLLAGGLFSLIIGVFILPLSFLGLVFYLVGAFGFIPFPTAVVYLRNGWRAADPDRAGYGLDALDLAALGFGFAFALAAPALTRLWTLSG